MAATDAAECLRPFPLRTAHLSGTDRRHTVQRTASPPLQALRDMSQSPDTPYLILVVPPSFADGVRDSSVNLDTAFRFLTFKIHVQKSIDMTQALNNALNLIPCS